MKPKRSKERSQNLRSLQSLEWKMEKTPYSSNCLQCYKYFCNMSFQRLRSCMHRICYKNVYCNTKQWVVWGEELHIERSVPILQHYGDYHMKPNHHFAVHLPSQIWNYGPVYGCWCFLTEWLNKLLKNFQTNNWAGGQLEVSMVREWKRNIQLLLGVFDSGGRPESNVRSWVREGQWVIGGG